MRNPLQQMNWHFIFFWQQYVTLAVHASLMIAVAVVHFLPVLPYIRPFNTTDFDIAYPDKPQTIQTSVAAVVPLLGLAISLLLGELLSARARRANPTYSTFLSLYFFVDALCALMLQVFCQQLSNVLVGELRPSFLADCLPDAAGHCTGSTVWARKSFYSGHAATGLLLAGYSCFYLLWTLFFRHDQPLLSYNDVHPISWCRLSTDLYYNLVLLWMLAMLTFAWATGLTRIVDNEHTVGDVAVGLIVGFFLALLYFTRAVGLLRTLPTHPVAAHGAAVDFARDGHTGPILAAQAGGGISSKAAIQLCDVENGHGVQEPASSTEPYANRLN